MSDCSDFCGLLNLAKMVVTILKSSFTLLFEPDVGTLFNGYTYIGTHYSHMYAQNQNICKISTYIKYVVEKEL